MSANTKLALSARPHFATPSATALHTPSTIHNQLAQLQEGTVQQPATSPSRQHSRHANSHVKRDANSHATSSSAVPTPLSRSALQNAERGAATSSLKRQLPSHRSLTAPQSEDQQSLPSPSQTEYRNPVFGQVRQICQLPESCMFGSHSTFSNSGSSLRSRDVYAYCTVPVYLLLPA